MTWRQYRLLNLSCFLLAPRGLFWLGYWWSEG